MDDGYSWRGVRGILQASNGVREMVMGYLIKQKSCASSLRSKWPIRALKCHAFGQKKTGRRVLLQHMCGLTTCEAPDCVEVGVEVVLQRPPVDLKQ